MLKVKVQRVDDAARIDFKGTTIDIHYGPIPEIVDLMKQGMKKILVNLGGVEYFTSAGISSLIATTKLARENNVNLGIYNLQTQVRQTIERTGMMKLLPIFDSEDEAACYVGIVSRGADIVKHEKILVIEKNLKISQPVLSLIDEFKHLSNYRVTPQQELEQAYNYLQDTKDANLILLDVGFNPVDAQKFLEKLGNSQKFKPIPVLVVTEDENITHAHFLVKNGASDILRYPINKYELESRINFALNYFQEFQKVKVPA